MFVTNRDEGSIGVIDLARRRVAAKWFVPGGGSPDMGNLSADGRVLWLSGRYNNVVYAIGPHGLYGVCNVWPPIAHAHIHRHRQHFRKHCSLTPGDLGQGRMPDKAVAVRNFFDDRIGNWPPASDVAQVLRNLGNTVWCSVRQQ